MAPVSAKWIQIGRGECLKWVRFKCAIVPVDIVTEAATSDAVVGDDDNGEDAANNGGDGGSGGIVDIDDGECIVIGDDENPFTGCPFNGLLCPLLRNEKTDDI